LRSNLDTLSHHKLDLRASLERNTRDRAVAALEKAASEIRAAANKALYAAIAKVKKMDLESSETITRFVNLITELSTNVAMAHDIRSSLIELKDLTMAVGMHSKLKRLLNDAAKLRMAIKQVPPLQITQIKLSDRLTEIIQDLKEIDLVVLGELKLSPRSL
uniref:Conserved oligomeric Golgi complex subunit 5 n=1 Tax=Hydatigena taeniaeformis TaxID=6205 RepID=A0A0R3WUH3_HYDTA